MPLDDRRGRSSASWLASSTGAPSISPNSTGPQASVARLGSPFTNTITF
jgi:hypothetical protein